MQSVEINRLIHYLSKLSGLGPRSAQRVALQLLKKRQNLLRPLVEALQTVDTQIQTCQNCYNLDTLSPCSICSDPKRQARQICVVEGVADLWALERATVFQGQYHILNGVLSAVDGYGPQHLTLDKLLEKVTSNQVEEVVLALNATVDGQTTIHYLIDCLKPYPVTVTTLAHGVPMGGELDYLDDGTLTTAFDARSTA